MRESFGGSDVVGQGREGSGVGKQGLSRGLEFAFLELLEKGDSVVLEFHT